jgi:5-methylcytosine-specific restriction endonuclease McrA
MAKWPYSTQRWQRYRRQKQQREPLCEYCLNDGKIEVAVAVDHIVPINRGGDPYPPLDHLMSCCASHHNQKTRAEQLDKPFKPKGICGCDVHGNPLDPKHDWYRT